MNTVSFRFSSIFIFLTHYSFSQPDQRMRAIEREKEREDKNFPTYFDFLRVFELRLPFNCFEYSFFSLFVGQFKADTSHTIKWHLVGLSTEHSIIIFISFALGRQRQSCSRNVYLSDVHDEFHDGHPNLSQWYSASAFHSNVQMLGVQKYNWMYDMKWNGKWNCYLYIWTVGFLLSSVSLFSAVFETIT